MIVVDPVMLGDVSLTRPSPKWVYDRTGTLVEVPANTLGVTYDPADLSKAPWALIEQEARNLFLQSLSVDTGNGWDKGSNTTRVGTELFLGGVPAVIYRSTSGGPGNDYISQNVAVVEGENYTVSVYARRVAGAKPTTGAVISCMTTPGNGAIRVALPFSALTDEVKQHSVTFTAAGSGSVSIYFLTDRNTIAEIAVAKAQFERGLKPTSFIPTTTTPVTRAADVVGDGAGLVYSNVPMVEPPYNVATTYAKDAAVYDPATKIVYLSMVAGNVGKALSDPAFWNKRTAINRWAMFDDRNSTQTSNPEEIVSVFSAQAITQGLFAGAMDASEVRVSMTHPTRGLVYSETKSLVLPRSGSSFYGWCFNRLRLRTWFLTLKLPVFANALVTVTIKKPGGVPKCGMCLLGPTVDAGLSLMGLSTELKDYSTTTFFTDGSSSTVERGFSKKMSVDISVESDRVESIEDYLIKRRQKTLVFLGSTMRGDTMLVGRFSSLRKVIDSFPRSKMALQIDGVLSQ